MSEIEEPERRGFSFVELYFGAKVIGGLFGIGLAVIFYAELFRPADREKPVWLTVIENVYLAGGIAAVTVIGWLFDTHEIQVTILKPNCPVEVVTTDTNGKIVESSRVQFEVKDVSNAGHNQGAWTQVVTKNGPRWTLTAPLTERRALPDCKS